MSASGLQGLLFALIIRPLLWVLIGLRVRNRERLPTKGPAVVVANHNSHLDTVVLLCLVRARALRLYRPAAAADHFMKPGLVGWIARTVLRILPIDRSGIGANEALKPVAEALERGEIVVLFPEGTRGEPEHLARFRRGIAVLVEMFPDVPVVPVFIYGLGRALPRGTSLLVPFFCDVAVGEALDLSATRRAEVPTVIAEAVQALGKDLHVDWHEGSDTDLDTGQDPPDTDIPGDR